MGDDARIGQGESVDFHAAELSTNDSEYAFEQGTAAEFDDDCTFELVLENGRVIRLQAFSLETRREWMRRLRDLIKYWKLRLLEDFNSLKEMRAQNLEMIKIDKGNESRFIDWIRMDQFAEAVSAPRMYHFCTIANCRTLSVSSRSQFCILTFVLDSWAVVCQVPSSSVVYQLYRRLNFENAAHLRTHRSFNSRYRPSSHPPQPNQIDRFAPLLRIQRTNGPIRINASNNVA